MLIFIRGFLRFFLLVIYLRLFNFVLFINYFKVIKLFFLIIDIKKVMKLYRFYCLKKYYYIWI